MKFLPKTACGLIQAPALRAPARLVLALALCLGGVSSAWAQATARPVKPLSATPGAAGALLSQADAASILGGYWRLQWGDGEQSMGVLQITGVNAADNQVAFEGQYSPDGLNICQALGNWVYSLQGHYTSANAAQEMALTHLLRMRLACAGREMHIEAFVMSNHPMQIVGRATLLSGSQSPGQNLTLPVTLRRFASKY